MPKDNELPIANQLKNACAELPLALDPMSQQIRSARNGRVTPVSRERWHSLGSFHFYIGWL